MVSPPLRVGIIGGGFGAAVHLPALALLPGVRVVALADSGSGKARCHARDGIEYSADWRALVARSDIDAITVAVPPTAQRDIVLAALRRGLHIFCEKPFGACPDDAIAMRDQARSTGRVAVVNYQFRFDLGIEALRAALRAGRIGRLRALDFCWLTAGRANPGSPWSWQHDAAAGGGVIGAYFSHVADLLLWLTGAEPLVITAHCAIHMPERKDTNGMSRSVTAEDSVTTLIEFSEDIVASCRVSNCQSGGDGMRIEIRGDQGMVVMTHRPPYRFEDCDLILYSANGNPELLAIDRPEEIAAADSRTYAVSRSLGRFLAATRGSSVADLPDAEDGVAAQCLMQAVRLSCENHSRLRVSNLNSHSGRPGL